MRRHKLNTLKIHLFVFNLHSVFTIRQPWVQSIYYFTIASIRFINVLIVQTHIQNAPQEKMDIEDEFYLSRIAIKEPI